MELNKKIEDLLISYSKGKATKEEIIQLEQWIQEDKSHKKVAEQIATLQFAADVTLMNKDIDTEGSLSKTNSLITKKERKIKGLAWLQRIAAMLTIPLLISTLWFYRQSEREKPSPQTIEIKTTPGMTTSLTLSDGSKVHLNSSSSLSYPSSFTNNQRNVTLSGEAYFEVTKDSSKPFIISVQKGASIEVHGTILNVEAYNDENISTTLIEGAVDFRFQKNGQFKKVILQPLEKLVYESKTGNTKLYHTSGQSETAWINGKIIFDNTPMNEAFNQIGKHFNIEFVFNSKRRFKDEAFTGTFSTQRFERIMEYFKVASGIRWRYINSSNINDKKQQVEIY
ncbi:MAG: FecR family protein [Phocaeicola sp.]|uniref:FecR family protein n=1 Tax=Phocaeicola TaxID=909656 RepID=UPI00234E856C|nr:FecR family protein [Phocaeicola oris]MCE2617626.1 FecR family protein [Phocaeicola oris]